MVANSLKLPSIPDRPPLLAVPGPLVGVAEAAALVLLTLVGLLTHRVILAVAASAPPDGAS